METNQEIGTTSETVTQYKTSANKITIVAITISLITCAVAIFSLIYVSQSTSKIKEDITTVQDTQKSDIEKMKNVINDIEERLLFVKLENYLSGRIVTDDFVLNSLVILSIVNDSGKIDYLMDIDTQPTFLVNYQGQGRFSISDRELKAAVLPLVTQFIENMKQPYPDFDKTLGTIYITIKNYDIGTYVNGELKLKGE